MERGCKASYIAVLALVDITWCTDVAEVACDRRGGR